MPTSSNSRRELLLGLLCAALSGASWFLATANFDVWPLAWFGTAPLLWFIDRASTTRRAVLFAWLAGCVTHAGGFYWITKLLARFGHLPDIVAILLYLLMAAYQAVTFLLFGLVVRRIRTSTRLPMTLVAPLAMVAFEQVIPYLFPCNLAISQAWQTHVIQIADLTGPLGVTALLFVANGALYDAWTRRFVPALAGAGVILAALVYGHVRIGQIDDAAAAAPKLKVGIVQGNISFDEKGYLHPEYAERQLQALQDRSTELEKNGAQLVVWSESSYPYMLPRDLPGEPDAHGMRTRVMVGPDGVRSLEKRFTVPLLFGAITFDVDADRHPIYEKDPYNTALMLDPDGKYTGRFDKMYLVMFSEHIPGVETFPWIRKVLPRMAGNFTPGDGAKVFPLHVGNGTDGHDYKLGPLICFEDIIPAFGRRLAALHPDLFVNITNDAWFGDSSEPWEHLALAVFRSVESRTAMVRSVNTGVSTIVDPNGRVVAKTYSLDPAVHPHPADSLLGEVPMLEAGHTIYDQIGDVFGYSDLVIALGLWLVWPRLSRRKSAASA
jgi:apolipoprotein N-acyltransferase